MCPTILFTPLGTPKVPPFFSGRRIMFSPLKKKKMLCPCTDVFSSKSSRYAEYDIAHFCETWCLKAWISSKIQKSRNIYIRATQAAEQRTRNSTYFVSSISAKCKEPHLKARFCDNTKRLLQSLRLPVCLPTSIAVRRRTKTNSNDDTDKDEDDVQLKNSVALWRRWPRKTPSIFVSAYGTLVSFCNTPSLSRLIPSFKHLPVVASARSSSHPSDTHTQIKNNPVLISRSWS